MIKIVQVAKEVRANKPYPKIMYRRIAGRSLSIILFVECGRGIVLSAGIDVVIPSLGHYVTNIDMDGFIDCNKEFIISNEY